MTNYYFGIEISKLVLAHQSIENSPTRLLEKKCQWKEEWQIIILELSFIKTCCSALIN